MGLYKGSVIGLVQGHTGSLEQGFLIIVTCFEFLSSKPVKTVGTCVGPDSGLGMGWMVAEADYCPLKTGYWVPCREGGVLPHAT